MRTLDRPEETMEPADQPRPPRRPRRRPAPAGRVLVVIVSALFLWALLAAPSLKRAAEASPDGARRTASLAVLTPMAAVCEALRISAVSDGLQGALGRDPDAPAGGELFADEPEEIPTDFGVAPEIIGTPEPPSDFEAAEAEENEGDDDVLDEAYLLREPTTENKLRVVVVGDSLAMGLSTALSRVFEPALVQFVDQGRLSTGLARADYFDWVEGMGQIADRFRPDVVVVLIGVNDDQSIISPGGAIVPGGTDEWADAYAERIDEFLTAATELGGRVVWIGLPPLADGRDNSLARSFNENFDTGVDDYRAATFFDTYERFSRGGGYAPFGRDAKGTVAQLRAGDGVHFTTTGYDALAREVVEVMRNKWGLVAKAIED